MLDKMILQAPVYLLIFVRIFAILMTLPLFSMRSVPRTAKIALAGYMSCFILFTNDFSQYNFIMQGDGVASLEFVLIAIGEGVIGIIMGFYVTIIFGAFSSAGQFIAFQMGFSAASTYDSLAQVENPLMGQFFNFAAMLVFLQSKWFQKLFLTGLTASFNSINAVSLASCQEHIVRFLLSGLTKLFANALVISLPIMGTLMLITVCTGLLSKAAPQMNLLSEGFPIMILTAFFVIFEMIPSLIDFFNRAFSNGFTDIQNFFISVSGGIK